MRKHEEAHTRSSENMLAQTPHDIVPREPAHNAGGASNSEQVPESQKQGQVTPTTKDKGNKKKKDIAHDLPLLGYLQIHAQGGKAKGARGNSCTRSDHRGDTVAVNKEIKSDPSTNSESTSTSVACVRR